MRIAVSDPRVLLRDLLTYFVVNISVCLGLASEVSSEQVLVGLRHLSLGDWSSDRSNSVVKSLVKRLTVVFGNGSVRHVGGCWFDSQDRKD